MGIPMDTQCLQCQLRRNLDTARSLGDEATATAFAKELLRLFADAPEGTTPPEMTPLTSALLQRFYHLEEDRFREEKIFSNQFALERMEDIHRRIRGAADPVFAGLQFAILGNYIDFSALHGQVSFQQLEELLDSALEMELDMAVYEDFLQDLQKGKRLLYLTDNAGEIVFDRIFGEILSKAFPHLQITYCVRGGYAMNDATREDAAAVGIPFPVIDNGICVPGTVPERISPEAKEAFQNADVILSKGQGNAETLLGCGKNIYYGFLIKCIRFQNYYNKPKLTPMFVKEK